MIQTSTSALNLLAIQSTHSDTEHPVPWHLIFLQCSLYALHPVLYNITYLFAVHLICYKYSEPLNLTHSWKLYCGTSNINVIFSVKKKPVGGVSIFGGADLFEDSKMKPKETAVEEDKEAEKPDTKVSKHFKPYFHSRLN